MNDYLQVPVLVFVTILAPASEDKMNKGIPSQGKQARAIMVMVFVTILAPASEDKMNKGIPSQGKQARAVMVMVDELFAIIFLARRTGHRNQQ